MAAATAQPPVAPKTRHPLASPREVPALTSACYLSPRPRRTVKLPKVADPCAREVATRSPQAKKEADVRLPLIKNGNARAANDDGGVPGPLGAEDETPAVSSSKSPRSQHGRGRAFRTPSPRSLSPLPEGEVLQSGWPLKGSTSWTWMSSSMTFTDMDILCRNSVQVEQARKGAAAIQFALRRREEAVQVSKAQRQQAAEWQCEWNKQQEEELKRMRQRRQEAEEVLRRERAIAERRKAKSWRTCFKRLQEKEIESNGLGCSKDEKIDRLRRSRQEELRAVQTEQYFDNVRSGFQGLPEEEQRMYNTCFSYYDPKGSGVVQVNELPFLLSEIGLPKVGVLETKLASYVIRSAAKRQALVSGIEGCDVQQLAIDIVPSLCGRLFKIRQAKMLQTLQMYVMRNTDSRETTSTSMFKLLGEKPKVEASAPKELERDEVSTDTMNKILENVEESFNIDTDNFSEVVLEEVGNIMTALVSMTTDHLILSKLDEVVMQISSIVQTENKAVASQQRQIQQKRKIQEELFRQFRQEITQLDQTFSRIDADGSGFLEASELKFILEDLGMMPETLSEARKMAAHCKLYSTSTADFSTFLSIVKRARMFTENRQDQAFQRAFEKYVEVSGLDAISGKNLMALLSDLGVEPNGSEERRVVTRLAKSAELTPEGLISSSAGKKVVARLMERLRQIRLRKALVIGHELGFSNSEFNELYRAFQELDKDGSGSLDMEEVKKTMELAQYPPEKMSKLELAFVNIDEDGSGALELKEFLRLVKFLDEANSLFANSMPLTTIHKLSRPHLLMILDGCKVPLKSCAALANAQLSLKVSAEFEVAPNVLLRQALSIETFEELMNAARSKGSAKPDVNAR